MDLREIRHLAVLAEDLQGLLIEVAEVLEEDARRIDGQRTIDDDRDVRVEAPVRGDRLAGMSFAFTGTLKAMTRDKAFDRVKALGGSTRTSVSRGTTYLVTNDPHSTSKKNLDALALGLQVISEAQFLALIGE